jgi:hypothetical protein
MFYFHWIAGTTLALAWFSRIVDAALGMPSVADVSRPEWDRNPVSPAGNPRVSIIVPARNEEESIEQALNTLLSLDYAETVPADHVVLFPRMIMKRPGEYMMIAFFQTMFMFGHRPWKVADPSTDDHMGVGAFNLVRRRVYDAVGTYEALRMEVLDDMKLGKVVKQAGFAQRNVFGGDLISIRWAKGAMGVVNNLTKNFFAVLSFQWGRTVISAFGLAFLNFGPFLGVFLAHGWARIPYAVALGSIFLIYIGMSWRSAVPPYYFLLHPVSTALFIYTLLRSMVLTLWNDGIVWRGTKYPLDELRKGMV